MSSAVKVLIIEDDPAEVAPIAQWLGLQKGEFAHFNPKNYMSGPQSIDQERGVWTQLKAAIGQHDPKVIVIDLSLDPERAPDFNGQSLCRDLRDKCSMLGLIVVSSLPGDMGLSEYTKWGANHGWAKPWQGGAPAEINPGNEANVVRKMITISARRASETCRF